MNKDKELRDLFSKTKIEASENLKYRIMQQIMTEKSLSANKQKQRFAPDKQIFGIFGIICVLAIALGICLSNELGVNESFIPFAISSVVICSTFLVIFLFDERRRSKRKN